MTSITDAELKKKQNELNRLQKDYYSFDLEGLKKEINAILSSKTLEIDKERDKKIKEI